MGTGYFLRPSVYEGGVAVLRYVVVVGVEGARADLVGGRKVMQFLQAGV